MSKKVNVNDLSENERFKIAQHFIKSYISARNGLKELNMLRSERIMQGDYAEYLVSKLLNLNLAENGVQSGFDATDNNNLIPSCVLI